MKICKPKFRMGKESLTQYDLNFLHLMPDGQWISWMDKRFKGVNRPHFRCVRLWMAGCIDWGVPVDAYGEHGAYYKVMVRRKPEKGGQK